MEARSAWTDERLDDRFDHIDRELFALRSEMRDGFAQMGRRTDSLAHEFRVEVSEFRSLMTRLFAAQTIALLGVIAAILARGA